MQRLQKGAKQLADGDLTQTVELKHMYGPFRQHGEYLNSISDGMQTAVDERVKSERMKAELITNVSHDIKTPLTNIVNYVDLLKKEPPANERAAEYLGLLDRQSQRLKNLTEDLVEASKESTGNIAVHAERTDLNVLLGRRRANLPTALTSAVSPPFARFHPSSRASWQTGSFCGACFPIYSPTSTNTRWRARACTSPPPCGAKASL